MATAWYLYPLDSPGGGYGQIIDPVCDGGKYCNYLKPDTNIAIPSGIDITSIDSGTVMDVSNHGSGGGGLSVTIKFDHPPNNVAQYVSYNYLRNASVIKGQRVGTGQKIGSAGSPTGINFALALGDSPSWGSGDFPQGKGDPRFDPHIVLNPLRSGQGLPTDTSGGGGIDLTGIGSAISSLQASFVNMMEEVGVFVIALVLIVLGILLLFGKQIANFTGSAAKTAAIV